MTASGSDPRVAVLRLDGDNDASTAQRVRGELTSAVGGGAPVVVDLTAATSLDAAVVRILLDGLAESERHERVLLLLLPEAEDSPVRRLFQISGLASLLPVVSSWDEALVRASGNGAWRSAPPPPPQPAAPGWTSPLS
ncbi:MAG TPA: STAS domain-containing protein [Gaiellaceae bacterium]|nr:STAS domain-containing protein [Gaiellaceae bacterium]